MATPHVTGALSVLFSAIDLNDYKNNPMSEALRVKEYLLNYSDDNTDLQGITSTGKRLNLHKSLEATVDNSSVFELKFENEIFDDQDNNIIEVGDVVNFNFDLTSKLDNSPDTVVNIQSVDDAIITNPISNLGTINTNQTKSGSVSFEVNGSASFGDKTLTLELTNSAGLSETVDFVFTIIKKPVDLINANWTFDTEGQDFTVDGNGWYHTTQDCGISGNPGYWHFGVDPCGDYVQGDIGTLQTPYVNTYSRSKFES